MICFIEVTFISDIGTIEQYLQSQYDFLEGKAQGCFPGNEVKPGVWVGQGIEIDPTAQVTPPAVLGNQCAVGAGAKIGPFAILGSGVQVGKDASIRRSVVWDNAWIGKSAALRGTVVGNAARVKAHASLFEGSVIGDRTVVGERSVVKPGVKIWPEKWVEKGTRLRTSLVWGNCARSHLFGERGVVGDLNIEMGPELACRLGMSAGSTVGLPARFALSTNGQPGTLMIKQGLLSGLMAVGTKVMDLGSLIVPVHRYAVRALHLKGGIHVCCQGEEQVCLRFFNEQGADYPPGEQRRVESIFCREEYRRVSFNQIPKPEYVPDMNLAYLNYLLEFFDQDITRRACLRVVVDYDSQRMGSLLRPLFESLGCEMVTFAAPRRRSQTFTEMLKTAEHFGDMVKEHRADFGVMLDAGGEELILVDEEGRIVPEDLLTSLISLVILSENRYATIALPVTASDSVEEIARIWGGNVRRTKTAPWALMQIFLDEEVRCSQGRYPQFLLYGDALVTLGVLMEYIARKQKTLSRILREIPSFATARREVEVTWENKGKVIRYLAENSGDQEAELLDGVKIYHPKGWALVLPDADEPLCRIYSEGFNQEIAESLIEMYRQKIQEFCSSCPPEDN